MAKKKNEGRVFGKCECGGVVRGVKDFDRWWTWCEKCTPTEPITLRGALNVSLSSFSRPPRETPSGGSK